MRELDARGKAAVGPCQLANTMSARVRAGLEHWRRERRVGGGKGQTRYKKPGRMKMNTYLDDAQFEQAERVLEHDIAQNVEDLGIATHRRRHLGCVGERCW